VGSIRHNNSKLFTKMTTFNVFVEAAKMNRKPLTEREATATKTLKKKLKTTKP
jgi:hypothetical protein